jgi:Putative transcription activator
MLSERLWASISDIYYSILNHPFIKGLIDGTLEEEKFKYYIIQDFIYLNEFSKALAILSSKSENVEESLLFASHVQEVIKVESSLHEYFIKYWNLNLNEYYPSPTNLLYTSFLVSTVSMRPYYEGVASVLPCYWIYMEVGKSLIKQGSNNELYKRWIETYAGEEYEKGVKEVIKIVDGFKLTRDQEYNVFKNFRMTAIFEYMFWDSAYKLEKFPFKLTI